MIKIILKYFVLFIFLMLMQTLVLNKMQISGYINPYAYIFFILMLPMEIPGWALLSLGVLSGLSIDLFANTLGIHASATLFLAFVRPYLLAAISPREGFDSNTLPSAAQYGWIWFVRYATLATLMHHFALFIIEVWSFSHFMDTVLKWMLSSFFTIVCLLIAELFNFDKKSR